MEYTKDKMVQEFAQRTLKNTDFVREHAIEQPELYEVTQLVNSLLGLIVFPKESALQDIPKTSFNNLRRDLWPESILVSDGSTNNLNKLITRLRNAVAHCNLGFVVDETNKLSGISLWNEVAEDKNARRVWQVVLTLDDLDALIGKLSALWTEKLKATNFEISTQ